MNVATPEQVKKNKLLDPDLNHRFTIEQVLVLSTSHVQQHVIDNASEVIGFLTSDDYSVTFHTSLVYSNKDNIDMDPDLVNLCELALKLGCVHLSLDCDGNEHEHLKYYNW